MFTITVAFVLVPMFVYWYGGCISNWYRRDWLVGVNETIERMVEAAVDQELVSRGETVVVVMGSRADGASDLMRVLQIR